MVILTDTMYMYVVYVREWTGMAGMKVSCQQIGCILNRTLALEEKHRAAYKTQHDMHEDFSKQ